MSHRSYVVEWGKWVSFSHRACRVSERALSLSRAGPECHITSPPFPPPVALLCGCCCIVLCWQSLFQVFALSVFSLCSSYLRRGVISQNKSAIPLLFRRLLALLKLAHPGDATALILCSLVSARGF